MGRPWPTGGCRAKQNKQTSDIVRYVNQIHCNEKEQYQLNCVAESVHLTISQEDTFNLRNKIGYILSVTSATCMDTSCMIRHI